MLLLEASVGASAGDLASWASRDLLVLPSLLSAARVLGSTSASASPSCSSSISPGVLMLLLEASVSASAASPRQF